MVLTGQLSNNPRLITSLEARGRQALAEPVRPSSPPTVRQHQHHLSAAEAVALAQAYQAGSEMRELAVRFDVHPHTVSAALRRLGIPLRRQGLSASALDEATQLYRAGWSLAQLGRRYRCAHTAVRAALIAHGVAMRPRPGWKY